MMPSVASPTRLAALIFRGKATLLQLRRATRDVADGVTRHPLTPSSAPHADFPFVLAESRSALWNEDDKTERDLQRGKVCNLRCALRQLHGARIAAGETFSFWKQIGRATRRRGYVEGRLLREGCLMPAVGGGLCQLSNALYQVALEAEATIVERWGHSRVVPGSAAQTGRDATVAWNYIDLRFRPQQEIWIEAILSADELIVRLRARHAPRPESPNAATSLIALASLTQVRAPLDVRAHSCTSCERDQCFRRAAPTVATGERTAFLVDECWPEFRQFVEQQHDARDVLALPLDGARWHQARYDWPTRGFARVEAATLQTLRRSLVARRLAERGTRRLQAQLDGGERLAARLARALSPDVTHVVVAQSLLPFLWRDGHLGGRTFEVLMTRLPLSVLHARLDDAATRHQGRATLREFRAPDWMIEAETAALREARVTTPHGEIARMFAGRVTQLEWQTRAPVAATRAVSRDFAARIIAFPGPTAARKGAYEVRAAARELGLEVHLCGSELEGESFWQGVKTRRGGAWLQDVAAVVQPSLVEEQPRRLIQALAAGVPVIASASCGLSARAGLTLVPALDEAALIEALKTVLDKSAD